MPRGQLVDSRSQALPGNALLCEAPPREAEPGNQVFGMNVMTLRSALIVALLAGLGARASAEPPSYARQIKPFLVRYCLECHNASTTKGDLDLETFKGMMLGGKSGAVVVPGKPDESRLVLLPEHKDKPPMPPKKARQPRPEEVAILRSWVAAGAKDDSANVRVTLPEIEPRKHLPAPITALAYPPDTGL